MLNHIIGVEEASKILNLSPGTVKNYCAEGKIIAKKIGKTWVIDKNILKETGIMETVKFDGRTYTLTEQAELTNAELDSRYTNYHEVENGEMYDFEMYAPAVDSEGNEVTVYWIFEDEKGSEKELDMFDYDEVDRVD